MRRGNSPDREIGATGERANPFDAVAAAAACAGRAVGERRDGKRALDRHSLEGRA
jgi:hypothetical protein